MPLLFSIGIQGVLEEVATHLVEGEQLCAFLDDVYLLCWPARVEPFYKASSRGDQSLESSWRDTWKRAVHCIEYGREDCEGKNVVGGCS